MPRHGLLVNPVLRAIAMINRVLLLLAAGEQKEAALAVARLGQDFPGSVDLMAVRGYAAAIRGQWRLAADHIAIAKRMVAAAPVTTLAPLLGHLADHLAQAQLGTPAAAGMALDAALDLARPIGMMRPFYDAGPDIRDSLIQRQGSLGRHEEFVDTLLTRWAAMDAPPEPASGTFPLLSPTELAVLRALPSRLTLDQIARQRGVGVNTVKTQVRSIYRKLAVSDRQAAVARARAANLLT